MMNHVAIFASGAGSNAQKIIDYFRSHDAIKISVIICNKANAGVVHIAQQENIPLLLVEKDKFFQDPGYLPQLRALHIDFIVLAGFLWKLPASLIHAYPKRIINIHPALLPRYGGKGMYGHKVHEAVVAAGDKESGISIHYVDEFYDHGEIILQVKLPVEKHDTPETLAEKIHAIEHANYAPVIEQIILQNHR